MSASEAAVNMLLDIMEIIGELFGRLGVAEYQGRSMVFG